MIVTASNRYELAMAKNAVSNQSVIDRYTSHLMGDSIGAERFFGKERVQSALDTLSNYKDSDIFRRVNALKNKGLSLFDKNEVRVRSTRGEVQNASPVESRYLTHFRRVRRGINKGILNGYSNRFQDIYNLSSDPDWYHPDHNRLHQGMVDMENEEALVYTNYCNSDEITSDDHLTFDQQTDLYETNRSAEIILDQGYDPTSDLDEKI